MVDTSKALQNIAKKGRITEEQAKSEFDEIVETMPVSPTRDKQALRELNNRYSGPPDNTGKYEICIVGLHKLGDFSEKTIASALAAYAKDPDDALTRGLVSKVGDEVVALDIQKSINYGKGDIENKNFGKPLEHSYTRNAIILAREEGAGEWVLSSLTLRNDFANSSIPEMYKSLNVNLLGSISEGLKTAKTSKFNAMEDAIDYNSQLLSFAKDRVFELGDVLDNAKKWNSEDPGFYSRFVITEGEVKFMNDPKKEGGNFAGTVDSFTTDQMVRVFIDPALGKPDVDQEYVFLAQHSVKKGYDAKTKENTDEDVLVLNVLGYYIA